MQLQQNILSVFFFFSVRLGTIAELPAETCHEIKSSEGQATSGKYWFSTIKTGTSILAYCDMGTEGNLRLYSVEHYEHENFGPIHRMSVLVVT